MHPVPPPVRRGPRNQLDDKSQFALAYSFFVLRKTLKDLASTFGPLTSKGSLTIEGVRKIAMRVRDRGDLVPYGVRPESPSAEDRS